MSIEEAIDKLGNPEAGSDTSSVPSGTVTPATAVTPAELIELQTKTVRCYLVSLSRVFDIQKTP